MYKYDIPTTPDISPASETQIAAAMTFESSYIDAKVDLIIRKATRFQGSLNSERARYILEYLNLHLSMAGLPAMDGDRISAMLQELTELEKTRIEDIREKFKVNKLLWKDINRLQALFYERMGFSIGETDYLPHVSGEMDFAKTGGQMKIIIPEDGELTGYRFISTIPTASALIWQEMHKLGAPVARILDLQIEGETSRVVGCFEGMNLEQVPSYFYSAMPDFYRMIVVQRQKILDFLQAEAVVHGHAHDGNITVLFYSRTELERLNPENVNLIDPDLVACTADLIEVMMNPNEWVPIVRLIDWDQARFRNPDEVGEI